MTIHGRFWLGLAVMMILVSPACFDSAGRKLVGTWRLDMEDAIDRGTRDEPNEEDPLGELVKNLAKGASRSIHLEIVLDRDGSGQRQGSALGLAYDEDFQWSLQHQRQGKNVLHFEPRGSGGKEIWQIRFVDRDHFTAVKHEGDEPLLFFRVKGR